MTNDRFGDQATLGSKNNTANQMTKKDICINAHLKAIQRIVKKSPHKILFVSQMHTHSAQTSHHIEQQPKQRSAEKKKSFDFAICA